MFDTWKLKREVIKRTKYGGLEWNNVGRFYKMLEAELPHNIYLRLDPTGVIPYVFASEQPWPRGDSEIMFKSKKLRNIVAKEKPKTMKQRVAEALGI